MLFSIDYAVIVVYFFAVIFILSNLKVTLLKTVFKLKAIVQ